MECLNCSFLNPENARFCQNCGQPMMKICPNCGFQNPVDARFCSNCGFNLAAQSGQVGGGMPAGTIKSQNEIRHARLAAAAPDPLAKKIRLNTSLAGERRVVTVLFVDVVGSTALAEQMDPEDWTLVMNRAFDLLTPVIYYYEGTIARLMGDALLAFFGAPVAHEDDPVRAVRAGLDLIRATSAFAEEIRSDYGIDFAVRVGINTGQVVMGDVGSDLVYEYTAMGDAVNLAARLQSAARSMGILVSESTYRFAKPYFEFKDLGKIHIRGKAAPVQAYEVEHFRMIPGKARGLAGLVSPLIGRDRELASLIQLCSAVRAGLGRAALVIGEAGLGKSRLIAEWREQMACRELSPGSENQPGGGLLWVEGQCLSYGTGLAYHLLNNLLHSLLGIPVGTDEMEIKQALTTLLEKLFGSENQETYPYLAYLLGVHLEGPALERVASLDPQAIQAQYLMSLRRVLRAMAAEQPLVLIIEDIHWADPSSVDLLVKLLPLVKEAPVLICCVSRPEPASPGWKLVAVMRESMGASLTEINLQVLSQTESHQLVSNLLHVDAIPDHLRQMILSRAEGNPFFVEEMIRMLIDHGFIVHQEEGWFAQKEFDHIEIPDNLQGLLLARIDRLPEEGKQTLRVASVIGREFPVKVLEIVVPGAQNIASQLSTLEANGLVVLSRYEPELEYQFHHTMIHEAAYDSLTKQDRKILHLAVGRVLEDLNQDNLPASAPVLARHFHEAEEYAAALAYYSMAGDAAGRVYANSEADASYTEALHLALTRFSPDEISAEQLIHLFTQRGRVRELRGDYDKALENYLEMESVADQRRIKSLKLSALMARAILYSTPTPKFDYQLGKITADQALILAKELDDQPAEARVYWALLLLHFFIRQPEEAYRFGSQALELARKLNLGEQLGFILNDMVSFSVLPQGDHTTGLKMLEEACAIWRASGNMPMLVDSLTNTGLLHFVTGSPERSLEVIDEAHEISHSIGNLWGQSYSMGVKAFVYAEMLDVDAALDAIGESLELADQAGMIVAPALVLSQKGLLMDRMGAYQEGLETSHVAVIAARSSALFWLAQSIGVLALVYIHLGQMDEAETVLEEARTMTQTGKMDFFDIYKAVAEVELRLKKGDRAGFQEAAEAFSGLVHRRQFGVMHPYAHFYRAKALQLQEEEARAYEEFQEACKKAAQAQTRDIWIRSLAELALMEELAGDIEAASRSREEGREVITYVLSHTSDFDLRKKFLNRPEVALLLNSIIQEDSHTG